MADAEQSVNPYNTVIGVDPGSRVTGYGVISLSKGQLECITYGVIRLNQHVSVPQRLVKLADEFETVVRQTQARVMAVETIFSGKNTQSMLKLGQARGVLLMVGARLGCDIHEYAPASIKQAVVGYGRATKEQIQFMILRLLKLHCNNILPDAADALASAICHINMNRIARKISTSYDRLH